MSEPTTSDTVPGTELLYHHDAYAKTAEATVVAIDKEARAVALDRTIVFPGGGGQPNDTGRLSAADGRMWEIVSAKKAGPVVWHILGGDAALPAVGDEVAVSIDWTHRYRLMRTHTALHVLCGTIYRDYGALVTGGNMGPDKARMDFEMESFNPDLVAEIERVANEEIANGRETRVKILPREEAFQIPDLIRTKINLLPEGISEIRTVEIVGLDLQADGGTHVANTAECGGIKIIGTRSKGKSNKRLELILVGGDGDEQDKAG
jgi:misacylated tRNA(Ala) deacylase